MSTSVIILSISFITVSFSYLVLHYNFNKIRNQYQKLFVDMMLLEKLFNESESLKINSDESVHKENFIKFLSDSRDWAYQYIEDVQTGLNHFVSEVEPEINYFKEHGDITSMSPNYYSMKKIAEEYEKLKTLLPKDEEVK
jgi:hypothetical protein